MPLPDPKAGSFFVWLVTCSLFLAIIGGGGFLLLYMTQPKTESTSWFPVAGVVLVCLPWFFWFLTFFYRIFSRVCGVRIGGGGCGGRGGGGGNVGKNTGDVPTAATNAEYSEDVSPGSNERHVHFGAAVVVDEQEGNGNQQGKDGNQSNRNSLSSTNSNNDIFYTSHESERPLALSMAS